MGGGLSASEALGWGERGGLLTLPCPVAVKWPGAAGGTGGRYTPGVAPRGPVDGGAVIYRLGRGWGADGWVLAAALAALLGVWGPGSAAPGQAEGEGGSW